MKKLNLIIVAVIVLYSCNKNITPNASKKAVEQPTAAVVQSSPESVQTTGKPKVGTKSILTDPNAPVVKTPNAAEVAENPRETPKVLEGKTIYKTKCGQCHDLKDPQSYDAPKWVKIVDWMAPKAKLDATQKANVLAYVSLYSKR